MEVMGKHIVTYSYNGTLLRKTKDWTTDKYNLTDESHRHYAELQKSGSKEHVQYGSICMKSK